MIIIINNFSIIFMASMNFQFSNNFLLKILMASNVNKKGFFLFFDLYRHLSLYLSLSLSISLLIFIIAVNFIGFS